MKGRFSVAPWVWLTAPVAIGVIPAYIGGLLFLALFSFYKFASGGRMLSGTLSFDNYLRVLDPLYVGYLVTTIYVGAASALGAVLIAFPVAYWIARTESKWRNVVVALVVLSMFVVSIVRVFAWTLVLGRTGFINKLLEWLAITSRPLQMLYSVPSVIVVEIHYVLPYVTLTLLTAMLRIDRNLEMAAQNLGASHFQVFRTVLLPLAVPGLLAAGTISFALTVSSFMTPMIIGGGRVHLLPNVIYDTMLYGSNYPFASALSMVAIALTLAVIMVVNWLGASKARGFT